ncbi:MAG: methionyl-tRNA formyltransferase [Verrucomicrobiota bacterium]
MKVLFLGTGKIGVPALRSLMEAQEIELVGVVTQPDRPIGRHQRLHASEVKQAVLLSKKNIPIFQYEKINDEKVVSELKKLSPEIVVVAAYGQILKRPILELGSLGIVNIHASLLPRHRGAACIPAAIRSGDKETGITIMRVEETLDAGDIFLQKKIPIEPKDTSASLEDKLAELAPAMLGDVLTQMCNGTLVSRKQDESLATYAKKLTKADGQIDWTHSAEQIERHIRAMIPWPTAYTRLEPEGKMLKIFSVAIGSSANESCGQILRVTEEGILVSAGQCGLWIKEVQLEGKKHMSAVEFARGHQLQVGTIFKQHQ